ncbi:MAG: hypothetical protein ACJATT_003347 [Myxococcota bacterium]|jgi:hypothetical protein
MTKRHKVFVSYHHAIDQQYRNDFETLLTATNDVMVSHSVNIGDIDPQLKTETVRQKIRDEYLRDSTVTVVLIGTQTWQRKHVDWEIASSVRHTDLNPRSGLLGILLPTYPTRKTFIPHTIPPRLWDNVEKEYAEVISWSTDSPVLQDAIHRAFKRRSTHTPTSSRTLFTNNRTGTQWTG